MISRIFILLIYVILFPFSALSLLTVPIMMPVALIYWIFSGDEEQAFDLVLFFPFKMSDLFNYITSY